MQNFQNFGANGGGGENFLAETPKRPIIAWFDAFWAIDHANPFTGFFSRRAHEKRDTTKSYRKVL